jgi:hypothetical protein
MPAMLFSTIKRPGLLRSTWVLVFVLAMMALPAAQAAGNEAQKREAKTACMLGDTNKGVALLVELYVSTGDPIYVFNQGRCFEQNGKYEEAILRFREFQRKNADAGRGPDLVAEQHMADCQALLDKQKAAAPVPVATQPAPAATPAAGSPPVTEAKAAPDVPPSAQPVPPAVLSASPAPFAAAPLQAANQVDLTQSPPPNQPQPEGSILGRWWFWTAVGVVVAGGVTAALLLTRGGGTKPFCPECDYSNGVNLQ